MQYCFPNEYKNHLYFMTTNEPEGDNLLTTFVTDIGESLPRQFRFSMQLPKFPGEQ